MTEYSRVSKDVFYENIEAITYRNQDIKETFDFGCKGIKDCYDKATHKFARYFILEEDGRPIVTVMLQRNGHIIFFISDTVNNKLALIKELKKLANKVTECCGAIITKTANWYEEAKRLNLIMGFVTLSIRDGYTYYNLGD